MEQYKLPDLPYEYNALEPYIDEETMKLHHGKHHAAYVNGLNSALAKLEEAREKGDFSNIQALTRLLAFHGSGHIMHCLFWESMCAASKSKEPTNGALFEALVRDFSSLESFKKQFSAAAAAVEGSGWAALAYEPKAKKLIILQIENHQKQVFQGSVPLLVLDVWEHSYYVKYQNRRPEYIKNWWNVVNWEKIEKSLQSQV